MTLYTTIRIPIERKNRNIPPTCKRDPSPLMLFMGILLPTYGPKRVFFMMVCFANTPLPALGIEEHFTYKLAGSVSMAYWEPHLVVGTVSATILKTCLLHWGP